MQVGETVATVTVGTLAGFLARLRQNGAPDDTAIQLHHHKGAGGWTLSADFEAQIGAGLNARRLDPREYRGPMPPFGESGGMPASAAEPWVRDETRPFDPERDTDASAVPA